MKKKEKPTSIFGKGGGRDVLTYEMIAQIGVMAPKKLLQLGKSGRLDTGSVARIAHWRRFMQRAIDALPGHNTMIQNAFSDDELQKLWQKTADKGTQVGKCPLLH